MAVIAFPPVNKADQDGLLALGGDLEIASLLLAYSNGIFPWPISPELPLAWFSPDPRGIILTKDLHIPKSLRKSFRNQNWKISINTHFEQVITNCATVPRKSQKGATWITNNIISGYLDFHNSGYAYSIEIKEYDELIAGLYGVGIANFVSGESMFHHKNNSSKYALISLLKILDRLGVYWLDTQMVTPVVSSLGGKNIKRSNFMIKLSESLKEKKLISIFHRTPKEKLNQVCFEVEDELANL